MLFALAALLVLLCGALALPFVPAITWAMALAVVAHPLHVWIERRVPGKPDLAAAITTGIVTIGLVAPLLFLLQQLVSTASEGLQRLQEMAESGELQNFVKRNPNMAWGVRWLEANLDVRKELEGAAGAIRTYAGSWIRGSLETAMQLLITVFLLFYLFRDRVKARRSLEGYLPLSTKESRRLLERIRSMIHATVYGSLVVALIQGVLGGIMFAILGIPGALLWGAVMTIFAIIPVIGTFVVWAPAAALLAGQGSWGKATILVIWGVVVVSLIDNLLYPILVGKEIRLHTALVFLAFAGGLILFGVSGIVLGPVILVAALGLIDVLCRRTGSASTETRNE